MLLGFLSRLEDGISQGGVHRTSQDLQHPVHINPAITVELDQTDELVELGLQSLGIVVQDIEVDDDVEVLIRVAPREPNRVCDTCDTEEHLFRAEPLIALERHPQDIPDVAQELIHVVLLANPAHRVLVVEPHNPVGLLREGLLNLDGAGIEGRNRPKLNLTHPAIGDAGSRTVVHRGLAVGGVQERRNRRHTVPIHPAVPLALNLPLQAD